MRVLILLLIIVNLGLGFTLANNVNHPEIDWKYLQTEHIEVVYHDPLRDDAVLTSQIAEETYEQFKKLYKIELDEKIQIFISDMDDIMNGYSALGKFIVIWVGSNDFPKYFTGKTKWLRRVISHEISHHFLTNAILSWADNFFPVAGSFPGSFHEGFAQFFSGEPWGYGRQDAALRAGIIGRDIKDNRGDGYHYATGFSMVKYLATFYDEEKLFELLKYRTDFKLFSFEEAFKETYGKSFKEFQQEWERYIYTYYYGSFFGDGADRSDSLDYYSINAQQNIKANKWHSINRLKIEGDNALIFGKKNSSQQYYTFAKAIIVKDSIESDQLFFEDEMIIEKRGSLTSMDISPNGKYIVSTSYRYGENNSIREFIELYNTETEETTLMGRGGNAEVDSYGNIYYVSGIRNSRAIYSNRVGETKNLFNLEDDSQFLFLNLSPDEKKLAYVKYDKDCELSIEIFNLITNKVETTIKQDQLVKDMIWSSEGLVVKYEDKVSSKGALKIYTNDLYEAVNLETPPFNLSLYDIEKVEDDKYRLLIKGGLSRGKSSFGTTYAKKRSEEPQLKLSKNYYNKWLETKPSLEISNNGKESTIVEEGDYNTLLNLRRFIMLPLPLDDGFNFTTMFMDPLGHNMVVFSSYLPYNGEFDDTWLHGSIINRQLLPNISLNFSKYKFLGGFYDDEPYYTRVLEADLTFSYAHKLNKPFFNLSYSGGFGFTDIERIDEDDFDGTGIIEDGSAPTLHGGIAMGYNLPIKNGIFHPAATAQFSYDIEGSTKDMGSDYSFTHNQTNLFLAYSPTYSFMGTPFLTFTQDSFYEWMNGSFLTQNGIGIDDYKNIPIEDILNNRKYLRGYSTKLSGEKLFMSRTESWLKLSDNLSSIIGIKPDLVSLGYLGVGAFYDHSILWSNDIEKTFISNGFEVKTSVNIFGLPLEVKAGRAYDSSFDKLDDYIQIRMPFDMGIF